MSGYKCIVILILLSLLSGFFWSHNLFGRGLSYGSDEPQYNSLAKSLYLYGKYAPSDPNEPAWYTASEPGYPIFLAGVYKMFGLENFDAARFTQLFIFAFTVILIYLLVCDLIGKKYGFLAGVLIVLFFPLAGMAGSLLREVLFTFLLVSSIYSLYRAQKEFKLSWFILAGSALGLAVFTNAIIEFFSIIFVICALIVLKKDFFRHKRWLKIALFVFLSFLPALLWNVQSYANPEGVTTNVKNGFILARRAEMIETIRGEKYFRHLGGLMFGYYFFEKKGFSPTEFMGQPGNTKKINEWTVQGYGAEDIGRKFQDESVGIILKNIPRFFAISLLDFLQFNGPMLPSPENLGVGPMQNLFIQNTHPGLPIVFKIAVLIVLRILFWLFFGFVIYGIIKSIAALRKWEAPAATDGKKWGWLLVVAVVLYFNLVYSALYGMARYSIPVYPFYVILFVFGICNFTEYVRHCRQSKIK